MWGEAMKFPVKVGLDQGSMLSPYIFTWIVDNLTTDIQDELPWCMLLRDDQVLIS